MVYPGKDGPLSSVRLESQREGIEDIELLRMLESRNRPAAKSIVRRVVRSFDDYTTDVRRFRAARKSLLEKLG